MSVLTMFRRLRGSVRTSAFEQNMDEELRHHLELETEALVARGMTPDAARDTRAPAIRQRRPRSRTTAASRGACAPSTCWRRTSASRCATCASTRRYTAVVLLTLGARHRRQHRDLQRRPRRAAAAAALRQRRPAGRGPPAGAEDRGRERRASR